MNNRPGTTRRHTRAEVAAELARLVAATEQKMILLQHASHNALRADSASEARHWLRHVEHAQGELVDASIDVADGWEALRALYPDAHDDGERDRRTGALRCACGRLVTSCNARVQLEVGSTMWVDEYGKLRDVSDAGSEAIPAGQR